MKEKNKGAGKPAPKKYDYTSTKRSQKRTSQDDTWAQMVSGGKYGTLRKLMTAIHKGEFALAETQPTLRAVDGANGAPI